MIPDPNCSCNPPTHRDILLSGLSISHSSQTPPILPFACCPRYSALFCHLTFATHVVAQTSTFTWSIPSTFTFPIRPSDRACTCSQAFTTNHHSARFRAPILALRPIGSKQAPTPVDPPQPPGRALVVPHDRLFNSAAEKQHFILRLLPLTCSFSISPPNLARTILPPLFSLPSYLHINGLPLQPAQRPQHLNPTHQLHPFHGRSTPSALYTAYSCLSTSTTATRLHQWISTSTCVSRANSC